MVIRGHKRDVKEESLGKRGEGDDLIPYVSLYLASTLAQGWRVLPRDRHPGQAVSTETAEREMRAQGADKQTSPEEKVREKITTL